MRGFKFQVKDHKKIAERGEKSATSRWRHRYCKEGKVPSINEPSKKDFGDQ